VFDRRDIVTALQTGNYLQGEFAANVASVNVFAKIGLEAAIFGMPGGWRSRRRKGRVNNLLARRAIWSVRNLPQPPSRC
jgi:hypothetical protein